MFKDKAETSKIIKKIISPVCGKIKMLKNNPRAVLYWGYKFSNFFRENTLNNGERYDPNILGKFNINDFHQEARYYLVQECISKDDSVLDIASGTGYGVSILADNCQSDIGVDVSEEAINYANRHYRKNSKINFVKSDIFNFNDLADVVVSFETIEHVDGTIEDVVKKILSLARKKLILSVPYKEVSGDNKYHVHFNISESDFAFLKKERNCEIKFLYQSSDGKINEKKMGDALSLIVIINKGVV